MKKMTANLTLAAALTLAMATWGASWASAEDKKPDNEVSFNVAGVSDYRFRGISQSRLQPALQGGADYVNNPSGFYAGTWLSSIKWTKDAGGGGDVELDLYAGKRGAITPEISYDVGMLGYVYPSNGLSPSANTFELYGQFGYGPAYVKYSNATTNLFGVADSKNSGYLDVGANIEMSPGWTLNLHAGHQSVKNNSSLAYTDYKLGVSKDFNVVVVGLALVGSDITVNGPPPDFKNLGKTSAVLSVSKTF